MFRKLKWIHSIHFLFFINYKLSLLIILIFILYIGKSKDRKQFKANLLDTYESRMPSFYYIKKDLHFMIK